MNSIFHSFKTKPAVNSVLSSHLNGESVSDSQNQNILMLLNEIKSENERLMKLLELQFRIAHAFDIPYHQERKWAQFKTEHRL